MNIKLRLVSIALFTSLVSISALAVNCQILLGPWAGDVTDSKQNKTVVSVYITNVDKSSGRLHGRASWGNNNTDLNDVSSQCNEKSGYVTMNAKVSNDTFFWFGSNNFDANGINIQNGAINTLSITQGTLLKR